MSELVLRPGIAELEAYVGGESKIAGRARVIKLSSNEGAFGPPPGALAAFRTAAESLHRYPDGGCTALRQAIGRAHGLDPERIVCGAGSDDILILLARAYAGTGDEVLISRHGFLIYELAARSVGAEVAVAPETDLTADVDALLARVSERTRILFLANPNNPTGSYLPRRALQRLRAGLPARVLLVVDAAYAEYVDAPDYEAGIELVDAHDNVVMTRTFSKIYGLGGLRIGWSYAGPEICDLLNRLRSPFAVSGPAQAAAAAAVEDQAFVAEGRRHNARWRAWLAQRLEGAGLRVSPSVCNFVLVHFPPDGPHAVEKADAHLKSQGIIARRVRAYGLPDALRITIGREDEVRAAAEALSKFMR